MREPEYYLGRPVRSLQAMLRQIADTDSRVLPVIPDGYYGKSTCASVRSFQEAYGLPRTGEADAVTWDTIAAVFQQTSLERFPPVVEPVWGITQVVEPGEFNSHIYLVQGMLGALSHFFPALKAPPSDGILGPETARGLRWVQRAAGIAESGALNSLTWSYLAGLYRTTTGDGARFREARSGEVI